MNVFINGLLLGLTLSIMVGPLLIGIVEASLANGWKAGIRVGIGIWISDLLFILACLFGLSYLQSLAEWTYFKETLGAVGGIVLIAMGVGFLVKQRSEVVIELALPTIKQKVGYLVKGFLINTINPFTFFFWITVSLSFVASKQLDVWDAWPFYLGIFIPIVVGDSVKAIAAHWIRNQIQSKRVNQLTLLSGLAFILFGIALIVRTYFYE